MYFWYLKQKLIFFSLSTILFRLCNSIQIRQKFKWWWHPAVYKRRYSFKVTKYWLINWRIFVEIRVRKKTWLLCSSYNPKKNLIANHLNCIGRNLDSQLGQYENFILMGDFNVEPNDATMKNFCQIYDCKNIVKDNTCFKSPINPNCIDLIITNRPKSFQEFGGNRNWVIWIS